MISLDRTWNRLASHPLAVSALAVLAQTLFLINSRALWFSDEVRYANAYENMHRAGTWVVLSLNGVPYPDKPPVYFWFLALLDKLPGIDAPGLFFVGAALSGVLFVWAGYGLCRATGLNRDVSFAAVCILLSTLFLAAIFHYSRMDLMFAALILASQACLYRGYTDRGRTGFAVGGFALAGLACLVKGPLGAIFPLLALAAFLWWRGNLRKLLAWKSLAGLAALALTVSAWVGAALLVEGAEFVHTVFVQQIFERATNTFHHKEGPLWYFAVLPLTWLPWSLFVAGLDLRRIFTREFWSEVRAERRSFDPHSRARSWHWACFLSAFLLLSALSGKVVIYVLPLFAPLAALTADTLLAMEQSRRARAFLTIAGFLTILGAGALLAPNFLAFEAELRGLWPTALILVLGAAGLVTLRNRDPRAALLWMALLVGAWIQPAGGVVAPSLDPAMSPKVQAQIMGDYIKRGYVPVAYDTYSGIYTYYAGENIVEIPKHQSEVLAILEQNPKVVLAMKKKHFLRWPELPDTLTIVHEQWIADQPYILLVQGPI